MPHAIEILNLSKTFGKGQHKQPALQDLTLSISEGEVFGFLGPNGAGKSTTIKLLMHFIKPDQGSISLLGQNVINEEFRQHLGYLSEFPCFYRHLTAKETLELGGRLSGTSSEKLHERIPLLLEQVSLGRAMHQEVSTFSKGMKQRLGCALALVHDPQILIFDEPMSGLDPLGRHQMKELISQLKKGGKTIFFSSHILGDIEDLCDRIGVIHRGNLLYCGELSGFVQNNSLEKSFVQAIAEWDKKNAQ